MDENAIVTFGLSKRYTIGKVEKYRTLREALMRAASAPLRLLRGERKRAPKEWFWALQDVSVEVKQGDVVGVLGRNGAGKTTLLKLLSRITVPTRGHAIIHGRVGSLLEVGTGFHPELTGRDNIFLNGAIIGMRRADIMRKFDEIVEFAEVGKFIDTTVKRYSSGMHARLAFAVAAHLEPEILIVDEVLSVGDAAFQKKCLGKMDAVAKGGRTVLFVSHNMSAAAQLCNRGILLSSGRVVRTGGIDEVVREYVDSGTQEQEATLTFAERPNSAGTIRRVSLINPSGRKTTEFFNDERIAVEFEYDLQEAVPDNHIYVLLERADGLLVLRSADDDYRARSAETRGLRQPGHYTRRVFFPPNILNEGVYQFRIVLGKRWGELDKRQSAFFRVEDRTDYRDASLGKRKGVVLFPLEWNEEYWSAEQGNVRLPAAPAIVVEAAPEGGLEAEPERSQP
jgi:lipopolysaccharide transport system ATP-binding protein